MCLGQKSIEGEKVPNLAVLFRKSVIKQRTLHLGDGDVWKDRKQERKEEKRRDGRKSARKNKTGKEVIK